MAPIKNSLEEKDLEYIRLKAKGEFETLGGNTLLFTGANGFLGYYFIKSILRWNEIYPDKKISLYALDSFPKGIPKWLLKGKELRILKKTINQLNPDSAFAFDYIVNEASID